jgi:ribosomal protein L11 methyltransferase
LAKLGARDIFACDCDAEAVKVSKENIRINKVAHRINVFRNTGCEFNGRKYDFIVSNILAEPLISMQEDIAGSLAEGGLLILSGFTSDDDSVLRMYSAIGLQLKFRYDFKRWTTLVLKKTK